MGKYCSVYTHIPSRSTNLDKILYAYMLKKSGDVTHPCLAVAPFSIVIYLSIFSSTLIAAIGLVCFRYSSGNKRYSIPFLLSPGTALHV